MADFAIRPRLNRNAAFTFLATAGLIGITAAMPAPATADAVAYLVNVTMRPGYSFPNADAALAYGHSVCEKIAAGHTYGQTVTEVQADFARADHYQASYLINQAVNELCPALIWELRNSAAHYQPPAP